jgi:hypothetical protein
MPPGHRAGPAAHREAPALTRPATDFYGRGGAIAVRRVVNEHIATLSARTADTDESVFDFFCECGDLRCLEVVKMTLAEYEELEPGTVRAHD